MPRKNTQVTRSPDPADLARVRVMVAGLLDGGFDFDREIGAVPGGLAFHCGKVNHANSSIVTPWLRYFGGLRDRRVPFCFVDVPPALITYFNLISNFRCDAPIISVIAPFYCRACPGERMVRLETPDRKTAIAAALGQRCPSCGSELAFDDTPKWYFAFVPDQNE